MLLLIRKAVILAAGLGTRLLPLTLDMPKEMIRVGSKPVIEHVVEVLKAGGVEQILVVVGRNKEAIMNYLGSGERLGVKWSNIDFVTKTVRITPEKGSNPRIFKMSEKLITMIHNLPKSSERIWIYKNVYNLEKCFRRQRKRVASKIGNPRLIKIHCHTLRHWKATTEYAKTKDILYVQKLLGHKSLKSTLRYTQLVVIPQNEAYVCKTAKTIKEAKELVEAGFEYVTDLDSVKIFHKRKTSYLGG